MADDKNVEPIKQILALGAPYPMVVLPVDGDYWMEGNYHILSRDNHDRPIYPSIDMSRCTLDEDESIYNYARNFAGKEHVNYAGEDMQLGPILMSVLLDVSGNDGGVRDQYLVVLRTKTKTLFRVIPANSLANEIPGPRDFIRYILGQEPEVDHFHPIALPRASEDITRFDEHTVTRNHKVGVLSQCFAQINEEEYLQNKEMSPALEEFMELMGEKVTLKDFPNYRGGLDVKYGQTGDFSYYTNFQDRELMFHVAPLLPFTTNDSQQLSRKRHIGNDIVTLVFQEANTPFTPSSIRSHVLHVFIVVQVEHPNTADTCYKVSVTAKDGVPKFPPSLPNPCIFKKGPEFRDFLLTKIINGEMAALKCEKFSALGERTRSTLFEQLVNELIVKNERLLDDFHNLELNNMADTSSPQKNTSFLSTFRSAWTARNSNNNGQRSSGGHSSSEEQTLKDTKNLGQSLSLNDLTLLQVEDSKKDAKMSSKEKKRLKKKGYPGNHPVAILKSQSISNDHSNTPDTTTTTTVVEASPKLRPRSAYQLDQTETSPQMVTTVAYKPRPVTFYADHQSTSDSSILSQSLPLNINRTSVSSPDLVTTGSLLHNGHTSPNHRRTRTTEEKGKEDMNNQTLTLALGTANAEIEKLKSEVNKLKFDKLDLVRQNVIHQREIKKLNERYAQYREDSAHIRGSGNQHRKEKRKDTLLVTSTEFV